MRLKLLFFSLLLSSFCYAQSASEKATNECCTCITKAKKLNLSDEQLKEKGTECMTKALTDNIFGLCAEYGYKLDDMNEETGRQIGERFAMKLMTDCPVSTEVLMMIGMDEIKKDENSVTTFTKQAGEVSGTITAIDASGAFPKVTCKTSTGDSRTFYWMKRFPGDRILVNDEYKGKKIKLAYAELEHYDAKKKDYTMDYFILEIVGQ